MYDCVPTCVCVWWLQRTEEGVGSPETAVIELPYVRWKTILGSLQEQQVPLATAPSLQPLILIS